MMHDRYRFITRAQDPRFFVFNYWLYIDCSPKPIVPKWNCNIQQFYFNYGGNLIYISSHQSLQAMFQWFSSSFISIISTDCWNGIVVKGIVSQKHKVSRKKNVRPHASIDYCNRDLPPIKHLYWSIYTFSPIISALPDHFTVYNVSKMLQKYEDINARKK